MSEAKGRKLTLAQFEDMTELVGELEMGEGINTLSILKQLKEKQLLRKAMTILGEDITEEQAGEMEMDEITEILKDFFTSDGSFLNGILDFLIGKLTILISPAIPIIRDLLTTELEKIKSETINPDSGSS